MNLLLAEGGAHRLDHLIHDPLQRATVCIERTMDAGSLASLTAEQATDFIRSLRRLAFPES